MGYAFAMGLCFGCKRPFTFNPVRVPSVVVDGERYPICAGCVERANPLRAKNGLPLIVPLPGAYDPCDESELE